MNYTVRVLFGPMTGCDLNLTGDDYFIVTNPGATAIIDDEAATVQSPAHAVSYTKNTLYIPNNEVSPNILLKLSDYTVEDDRLQFKIEIYDSEKTLNLTLSENEIFEYGSLRLALKRGDSHWSSCVDNYDFSALTVAKTDTAGAERRFLSYKVFILLILIPVVIGIITVGLYAKNLKNSRIEQVKEVLSNAPGNISYINNQDDSAIYIICSDRLLLEWVKTALLKIKDNDVATPLLVTDTLRTTLEALKKSGFPVFQIDFSIPQQPTILVHRLLNEQESARLKKLFLKTVPFAKETTISYVPAKKLLSEAQLGLDKLHIKYKLINTSIGYSLVVKDALNDTTLHSLVTFINNFYQKWGNYFINYSINLNEDWLRNKSYLDSKDGYLFINPHHWYFPVQNGDFKYDNN